MESAGEGVARYVVPGSHESSYSHNHYRTRIKSISEGVARELVPGSRESS